MSNRAAKDLSALEKANLKTSEDLEGFERAFKLYLELRKDKKAQSAPAKVQRRKATAS